MRCIGPPMFGCPENKVQAITHRFLIFFFFLDADISNLELFFLFFFILTAGFSSYKYLL